MQELVSPFLQTLLQLQHILILTLACACVHTRRLYNWFTNGITHLLFKFALAWKLRHLCIKEAQNRECKWQVGRTEERERKKWLPWGINLRVKLVQHSHHCLDAVCAYKVERVLLLKWVQLRNNNWSRSLSSHYL